MRLVGYDLRSMIIVSEERAILYRDGSTSSNHELTPYAVARLGHVGFKTSDIEVNTLDEAWEIVNKEALRNHRVIM